MELPVTGRYKVELSLPEFTTTSYHYDAGLILDEDRGTAVLNTPFATPQSPQALIYHWRPANLR